MISPLARLSRLIVTGKDRAKYLHNFCTNNIKELPSGRSCEAFFCDVKARILAHGYVLAFDDCHEIWMLAGDEPGILKHLNRYIITEDVTIESATEATSAFAAIGATSTQSLLTAAGVADNVTLPKVCMNRSTCTKLSPQNGTCRSECGRGDVCCLGGHFDGMARHSEKLERRHRGDLRLRLPNRSSNSSEFANGFQSSIRTCRSKTWHRKPNATPARSAMSKGVTSARNPSLGSTPWAT
jgi:folate-binding Fe-S cluster repair protein YgfZ